MMTSTDTITQEATKQKTDTHTTERCDACGARALTFFTPVVDLPPLHLCGHHLRKHFPAILARDIPVRTTPEILRAALLAP